MQILMLKRILVDEKEEKWTNCDALTRQLQITKNPTTTKFTFKRYELNYQIKAGFSFIYNY